MTGRLALRLRTRILAFACHLASAAFAVVLTAASSPVHAWDCASRQPSDYDSAGVLFIGELVTFTDLDGQPLEARELRLVSQGLGGRLREPFLARFRVLESWRGVDRSTAWLAVHPYEAEHVPYGLAVGGRALIALAAAPESGFVAWLEPCSGSFTLGVPHSKGWESAVLAHLGTPAEVWTDQPTSPWPPLTPEDLERYSRGITFANQPLELEEGFFVARLLFMSAFDDSAVVTVHVDVPGEGRIGVVRLCAKPEPDALPVDRFRCDSWERELKEIEIEFLRTLFARLRFWDEPGYSRFPLTCDGQPASRLEDGKDCTMTLQSDGIWWFLEARDSRRYHQADAQQDDEPIATLGRAMLDLAGIEPSLWRFSEALSETRDAAYYANLALCESPKYRDACRASEPKD